MSAEGEEALPPGWAWATVGEVGVVQLGRQRAPEHHRGPHMRKYLRVANVFEDAVDTRDVMEMNFSPDEFEQFRLEAGDILLNEGQSRELVGRPAMFRGEVDECCFTNSLVRFRAGECVVPMFALYLFRHWLRDGTFMGIANITTNIAHLGAGRFAALSIPVPPLAEQRRIVAALDEMLGRVRAARASLDEAPSLLERARQAVLAAAFRGELTEAWREEHPEVESAEALLERIRAERRRRWEQVELAKLTAKGKAPTDERWKAKYEEPQQPDLRSLGPLPDSWRWAGLSEIATLQLGQRRAPEFANEREYPYIRAANITWRGLDLGDVKRMGFLHPEPLFLQWGDVLLNEASGSPMEVGKAVLWRGEIEGCCYQATVLRVRPALADELGPWLQSSFRNDALLGRFATMAPGMGMVHLSAERMRCWPIPLPPLAEQHEIVRRVDAALAKLDAATAAVEETRARLDAIERAVLARAFRGELVEQDADDEPAAEMLARLRASRAEAPTKRARRVAKA